VESDSIGHVLDMGHAALGAASTDLIPPAQSLRADGLMRARRQREGVIWCSPRGTGSRTPRHPKVQTNPQRGWPRKRSEDLQNDESGLAPNGDHSPILLVLMLQAVWHHLGANRWVQSGTRREIGKGGRRNWVLDEYDWWPPRTRRGNTR